MRIGKIISLLAALMLCGAGAFAQDVIRLGIIGLDTSHSVAFTSLINGGKEEWAEGFRVVAAYPYGSRTIESSYSRIPGYVEDVSSMGVEIVDSIQDLLDKVDCVFIETNDGRLHLDQAVEVFRSGKTCYIDKPLGATLGEAIAICEMAERYGVPIFSSSTLRFTLRNRQLHDGEFGKVLGADCWSPHKVEPTHPDFGFYGIHGVETLYTIMGTGCEEVNRISSEWGDIVTGRWNDGRLGSFRAIVKGPQVYGGTVMVSGKTIPAGGYEGYSELLKEILQFFRTGISPVPAAETIEIFTFMKAANMSKSDGGRTVKLAEAYKAGLKDAKKLMREYDRQ